jgi:serine/threonine-protein kinase
MAKPQLIGPGPRSTPSGLRGSHPRPRALPPDLLREASLRLGIMALLAAVLWTVGTTLGHLAERAMMPPGDPRWRQFEGPDGIAAASVVVSLLLFAYTRWGRAEPRVILELGHAYLVAASLSLGFMFHWAPTPADWPVRPEISWIGAVVLVSAAIVPSEPRRTLLVSLVAVSMNPVSMLIARARGSWEFGPASNALLMHYPDFLLAGVAAVISRVVTTLGQQVTKARELGSYRLGALLGRGGMGEVYAATHLMLARPAAIKLIRPEVLGGDDAEAARLAVARFRREAEAAASLRSPHTVELYDFGVTDDGTFYLVMELLDGMDLEWMVRTRGPVPAARAIHILRQVCDSLAEAHARGLVHRDIKPANIHVGRLGLADDFVKVLDFGLVKGVAGEVGAATAAGAERSLATAAGLDLGTPAYMAPEMALGEPVDGRADLYALGCVAYFLLTGQLVFEAESAFQVVARHLQAEPQPPSARAPLAVPPALDALVLRCLAKSPNDRLPSAAALARALAGVEVAPWGEAQAAAWWTANGSAAGSDLAAAGAGDDWRGSGDGGAMSAERRAPPPSLTARTEH